MEPKTIEWTNRSLGRCICWALPRWWGCIPFNQQKYASVVSLHSFMFSARGVRCLVQSPIASAGGPYMARCAISVPAELDISLSRDTLRYNRTSFIRSRIMFWSLVGRYSIHNKRVILPHQILLPSSLDYQPHPVFLLWAHRNWILDCFP